MSSTSGRPPPTTGAPVALAASLHLPPGGLVKYVLTAPGFPDPYATGPAVTQPPSLVALAPDVQIPQTVQYSVGVDH